MTDLQAESRGRVSRLMFRCWGFFGVPLLLGIGIGLAGLVTCWTLERLLVNYTDHDRRLWEGGAVWLVIDLGDRIANSVLRRIDAKKKEGTSP